MATTFFLYPGQPNRALDANADPVAGAKMYFFEAGTSTPLTVYSDTGLSMAHASPLVADANGYFAAAYVSGPDEVKIRVDDASDNVLYTIDYVTGTPVGGLDAASVPFTATSRISADDTQEAIEDVDRVVEKTQAGFDLVVTTGSANAYLLNTAVSSYTTYASGDVFLLRASFANTGACTLNVDSVGAKSLKFYTAGSKADPASGEIQTGHILRVEYDGTDFVVTDHWMPLASQAQAEAGTAQGVLIDPLRMQQHSDAFVGVKKLLAGVAVSGATYDISLPSGYTTYEIDLANFVPASGTSILGIRFQTAGGSVRTGASDYSWELQSGGATSTVTADSEIQLGTVAVATTAGAGVSGRIVVHNPRSSSNKTIVTFNVGEVGGSSVNGLGAVNAAAEDNDVLRILFLSQNIAAGTVSARAYL